MARTACVIVNYNDWKRTLDLVQRIVNYNSLAYIIVVNNASTDESKEKLIAYNHPKYIYLESDKNGGYGYGNNIGIRKAHEIGSDYILIANPDVEFSDQCVEHMLHTLLCFPKCAVIGAKETYLGTYGWRYTSGLDDVLSASLILNKIFHKRYYNKKYFENKKCVSVDIIPGCFLLTRADIMIKYGMYDEDFFLYEEEKVLYKKFYDAGYISLLDLNASFEHHHIEDSKQGIKKCLITKCRLIKSKRLFLKKYRRFNNIQLKASDLFFSICIFEMLVYSILRKIR